MSFNIFYSQHNIILVIVTVDIILIIDSVLFVSQIYSCTSGKLVIKYFMSNYSLVDYKILQNGRYLWLFGEPLVLTSNQ